MALREFEPRSDLDACVIVDEILAESRAGALSAEARA